MLIPVMYDTYFDILETVALVAPILMVEGT